MRTALMPAADGIPDEAHERRHHAAPRPRAYPSAVPGAANALDLLTEPAGMNSWYAGYMTPALPLWQAPQGRWAVGAGYERRLWQTWRTSFRAR